MPMNPCVAEDGQTYDYVHLLKWLKIKNQLPLSKLPCDRSALRTNLWLIDFIQQDVWLNKPGKEDCQEEASSNKHMQ